MPLEAEARLANLCAGAAVAAQQRIKEPEVRLMSKILPRGTVALTLFHDRKEGPELKAKLVDIFTGKFGRTCVVSTHKVCLTTLSFWSHPAWLEISQIHCWRSHLLACCLCLSWCAVLDTPELADIFALRMPELFDLMLKDDKLVDVAARLLGIIPETEVPKQVWAERQPVHLFYDNSAYFPETVGYYNSPS
eukprot:scaffold17797_cov17-Prasinocladus_malaysianus.AAC.1